MENQQEILSKIVHAIEQRRAIPEGTDACRLFNGFYEGAPGLVLDRYGPALVIINHTESEFISKLIDHLAPLMLDKLPDLESVLLKQRWQADETKKNGVLIAGASLPESIRECGVAYALDLQMNQDASFYLDTRELRRWLLGQAGGMRVLNTFAYTGSLGVAAGVGGAAQVVQTDHNQTFLNLAQRSWGLNNLDVDKHEVITGDFFRVTARLRHAGRLFDCVILDPPFFSSTDAGRVDLEAGMTRLINKVRPLVAHEGFMVVINNALFLSGADCMAELNRLCQSDYLSFEQTIPVPPDVAGFAETIVHSPPTDPAPFNHPTKIALLRAFRKDKRK